MNRVRAVSPLPLPPPPFVENNRYTGDNKKTWIEIREIDELTDRSHECLFSRSAS